MIWSRLVTDVIGLVWRIMFLTLMAFAVYELYIVLGG